MVASDRGFACLGHVPGRELPEIARQERKAVGGMAEEIAFDERLRDDRGMTGVQAAGGKGVLGVADQRAIIVALAHPRVSGTLPLAGGTRKSKSQPLSAWVTASRNSRL